MANQSDALTALAALKTQIDAIPAPAAPVDEQPVVDAITAISADVAAKFPPAA